MFKVDNYPEEIAEAIYNASCDADGGDYEETKQSTIDQLTDALYDLKAICENELNADHWRTLYTALDQLTDRL